MDLPNLSLPEPVQLPPVQLTEPAQVLQERRAQDVAGSLEGIRLPSAAPVPLPPLPALSEQVPSPSPSLEMPKSGPRPGRLFPQLVQTPLPTSLPATSHSLQLPTLPPEPAAFPQLPLPSQPLPTAFPTLPNADRGTLPQAPVVAGDSGLTALAGTFSQIARDLQKLVDGRQEKKTDSFPTEPNLPRGYL